MGRAPIGLSCLTRARSRARRDMSSQPPRSLTVLQIASQWPGLEGEAKFSPSPVGAGPFQVVSYVASAHAALQSGSSQFVEDFTSLGGVAPTSDGAFGPTVQWQNIWTTGGSG